MSQTFWSQYRQNPYGVKGARSARGSHSYGAIAYGATEEKPSKGLAAIVIPLAMAYLLYEGFLKPKKARQRIQSANVRTEPRKANIARPLVVLTLKNATERKKASVEKPLAELILSVGDNHGIS